MNAHLLLLFIFNIDFLIDYCKPSLNARVVSLHESVLVEYLFK